MKIIKEFCNGSPDIEISIEDIIYDLQTSIEDSKSYGQIEKLEAKINILYSILTVYLKKESLEETLVNLASMESNYNSYYIEK